jgi:hypothetical protein
MPGVTFVRNELRVLKPQYRLVRDVLAGEVTVKARGGFYLPAPNPEDVSKDAKARYRAYLTRAVFYGVTGRTLRGMVGQIFNRDPQIDVPPVLNFTVKDVNGAGVQLVQQLKQSTGEVVGLGRAGILSDFPTVGEGGATAAEINTGKVKPSITMYTPEQIINWRYVSDGGERKLVLVVLEEKYFRAKDKFETVEANRWRVLRLNESGVYVQELYLDKSSEAFTTITVTDFYGNALDYIPFDFIGGEDNDSEPDPVTMYDIASLNIAHYRNSADHEESIFMLGQPTPVFTGLTKEWVRDVLNGKVLIGSRVAISLPVGGKAELLQAEPNTLAGEGMATKERQMVALGAKLVEQKTVQRTATEATQEETAESSQLGTIAQNVGAAYTHAMETCARFVSDGSAKIVVRLNTSFDITSMDPAARAQVIKEWQSGAITFGEMRAVLRRAGSATEDDIKALAKIEQEQAAMLANDPNPPTVTEPNAPAAE